MNWNTKILLALTLLFAFGCASTTPKTSDATQAKASVAKNGIFYVPGSETLDESQIAIIINESSPTLVMSIDNTNIPQPIFGAKYKKFATLPGTVKLSIEYDSGSGWINGRITIASKVQAGKVYALVDDEVSDFISYSLVDVKTKQKTRVVFLDQ